MKCWFRYRLSYLRPKGKEKKLSLPPDFNLEATSSGGKREVHQIIKWNKDLILIKNILGPTERLHCLRKQMCPGLSLMNNANCKEVQWGQGCFSCWISVFMSLCGRVFQKTGICCALTSPQRRITCLTVRVERCSKMKGHNLHIFWNCYCLIGPYHSSHYYIQLQCKNRCN